MSSRGSRGVATPESGVVPVLIAAGVSLIAACFALLACVAGTSAVAEDSEGVRPLLAGVAVLALAAASYMAALMARTVMAGASERSPAVRRLLWISAGLGALTVLYVFLSAAPGGPAFRDSWGELAAGVFGLSVAVVALSLIGERMLWRFVAAAGAALLVASVVIAAG
jgi:hypothetical protein